MASERNFYELQYQCTFAMWWLSKFDHENAWRYAHFILWWLWMILIIRLHNESWFLQPWLIVWRVPFMLNRSQFQKKFKKCSFMLKSLLILLGLMSVASSLVSAVHFMSIISPFPGPHPWTMYHLIIDLFSAVSCLQNKYPRKRDSNCPSHRNLVEKIIITIIAIFSNVIGA